MNLKTMQAELDRVDNLARMAKSQAGEAVAGAQNRAYLALAVAPDNLTAPSLAVIAAALLTPAASGLFFFSFTLAYSASAADSSFAVQVRAVNGATGVTGGTLSHGLRVATGSPVVVAGGAAQAPAAGTNQRLDATGLVDTVTVTGFVQLPAGASAIEVLATSGGGVNYSGMALSGGIVEQP